MAITKLNKSAVVSFSSRQMFALVNAIEEYPKFLPWCHKSRIIKQSDKIIEASIEIAWSGLHKSFTTRNYQCPEERIDIKLINGPFKQLTGHWTFQPTNKKGCKVSLNLEFELAGNFLDRLFQPVFYHIASSMVEAFCKRAGEIYGKD